jgi:hypothetical protein
VTFFLTSLSSTLLSASVNLRKVAFTMPLKRNKSSSGLDVKPAAARPLVVYLGTNESLRDWRPFLERTPRHSTQFRPPSMLSHLTSASVPLSMVRLYLHSARVHQIDKIYQEWSKSKRPVLQKRGAEVLAPIRVTESKEKGRSKALVGKT